MTKEELRKIAEEEAKKRNIPPGLALAIIDKESNWNPNAQSPAGAQGLMQLMPGTAKELGVKNPLDPIENMRGGMDYLKQQMDEFKTPELALAANNAGPGNVRKFGGIPRFRETQDYVPSVLSKAKEYGFDPSSLSIEPDKKLIKPDFQSIAESDAMAGEGLSPLPEQKKQSVLGRLFGTTRGPETIDEYGNKKPGEFKEGILRKVFSFAAPFLFGMFPNPVMAALNVALMNKRGEDFAKAGAEDRAYQDTLEHSRKLAEPSEASKKFKEWQKMTPEERKAYGEMQEASMSPLSMANFDYRKIRDQMEDRRREEENKDKQDYKLRDDETSFRKEFSGNQIVKDYNDARLGMDKIRKTFEAKDQTGFNDQALIFNFMKVLDPGSVVREGEYATAMKNASLLEGMGIKFNKVMSGQQLSPDQRAKLKNAAEMQFKASDERFSTYKDEMTQIAKQSGLDPTKVIPNYDKVINANTASSQKGSKLRYNPATGEIENY